MPKHPARSPIVVRTSTERAVGIVLFCSFLLFLIGPFIVVSTLASPRLSPIAFVVCLAPMFGSAVWAHRVRSRTERVLLRHDDTLGTRCRYPLDSIAAPYDIRCPECGAEFVSKAMIREAWHRWRGRTAMNTLGDARN